MRQLGELVNIAIHAPNEPVKLCEHFCDICGNFRQRSREDIEIVIAVHFQLAKFGQRMVK
jgi:hypothetical protein